MSGVARSAPAKVKWQHRVLTPTSDTPVGASFFECNLVTETLADVIPPRLKYTLFMASLPYGLGKGAGADWDNEPMAPNDLRAMLRNFHSVTSSDYWTVVLSVYPPMIGEYMAALMDTSTSIAGGVELMVWDKTSGPAASGIRMKNDLVIL